MGGESLFLRKLVLGIPAQASGKNLTRPLLPSAPQPSYVHGTSPHHRKLGAGFVPLPQMTGRCFGKPFILSPPTLALRFRQNNGSTPSGDYQPSCSLSMAGSDSCLHLTTWLFSVLIGSLSVSRKRVTSALTRSPSVKDFTLMTKSSA